MFSELRKKVPNLVHLGEALVPLGGYAATVAWETGISREGIGSLPAFLLD
jgi:hypothetical protein